MRFFKSFTLLHRKTKSDGNITAKPTSKGHAQTRSLSFVSAQHFDEQVLVTDNAIFDAVVPTSNNTPTIPIPLHTVASAAPPQASKHAPPTTNTQVPALHQRIRTLESENAMLKSADRVHSSAVENALNHRIRLLQSELAQATSTGSELQNTIEELQATIEALYTTTIEELQEEVRTTRDQLYDTLQKDACLRRQAKADDEEIERLEGQLTQCTKFLGLLIDIGLHEPVLSRVQVALRVGDDADEALIESIKEAAARPGSPWARIIPAITGPRTSDHYLSAINTTLKVRRELKESKKVAKFWKETAKENQEHADTITPSTSAISSIHEVLSEERQYAVDELLYKLKNGPRPVGARATFAQSSPPTIVDDVFSTPIGQDIQLASTLTSSSIYSYADPSRDCTSPSIESARNSASTICPYVDPVRDCTSPSIESNTSARHSASTILGRYVPNLAPLASESFKEELVATESFKHLSKRASSSSIKGRTVLGEVDLNRDRNAGSKMIPSDSVTTQGSKRSAKALGKRRALVVAESIDSIEAVYGPGSSRTIAVSTTSESALSVLCNKECQQKESRPIPVDSVAFDTPAIHSLTDSARNTVTAYHTYSLPARSLVVIDEELETSASSSSSTSAQIGDRDDYDTIAIHSPTNYSACDIIPFHHAYNVPARVLTVVNKNSETSAGSSTAQLSDRNEYDTGAIYSPTNYSTGNIIPSHHAYNVPARALTVINEDLETSSSTSTSASAQLGDRNEYDTSALHTPTAIPSHHAYNVPARALTVINEDLETSSSSSTSASAAQLSDRNEYDTSATTNVNAGDDSEICSTLLPDDFSYVAESILSTPPASPRKTVVVTPSRASPPKTTSPAALSRLPVFKHFRRLSVSVGLSKGPTANAGVNLKPTTPLVVKKKPTADISARSTPAKPKPKPSFQSPAPPTPSSIPTPSRLSTPTKNSSPGRRIVNSGRRAARTLSRIVS